MKHGLLVMLTFFMAGALPAKAQVASDLNEGLQVAVGGQAEEYVISWWGKTGRTYFVQQSFDLMTWQYVPVIESGAEAVCGLNVSCSETRQFWRLRYTDQTYTGTAAEADFDNDGVPNQEELDQGLDALDPDSDSDGYYDGQELAEGSDPLSAGSAPRENEEDTTVAERPVFLYRQSKSVGNDWYAGYVAPPSSVTWYDHAGVSGQLDYAGAEPRWGSKLGLLSFPAFSANTSHWDNTGSFSHVVNTLFESLLGETVIGRASVHHQRVGLACDPAGPTQPWTVLRRFFSYRKTLPYPYDGVTPPEFSQLRLHPFVIQPGQHASAVFNCLELGVLGGQQAPVMGKGITDFAAGIYLFPWNNPVALDSSGPELWLTLPAGGGVDMGVIPNLGHDPLVFKVQGGDVTPAESTSTAPIWSVTYSVAETGTGGGLHVGLAGDTATTPEPLLRFDVKPRRELKITIQPIGLNLGGGNVLSPATPPTEADLKAYLDEVFGPQANVYTTVNPIRPQVNVAFDTGLGAAYGNRGVADGKLSILQGRVSKRGFYSAEEEAILEAAGAEPDATAGITIYWVGGGAMDSYQWDSHGEETEGSTVKLKPTPVTGWAGKAMASTRKETEDPYPRVIWVLGWSQAQASAQYASMKWVIAHELGHALADVSHTVDKYHLINGNKEQAKPDNINGFSPYSDNTLRLMTGMTGNNRRSGPVLLNKFERDRIPLFFLQPNPN